MIKTNTRDLTDSEINRMKERYDNGMSITELCRMHSISPVKVKSLLGLLTEEDIRKKKEVQKKAHKKYTQRNK